MNSSAAAAGGYDDDDKKKRNKRRFFVDAGGTLRVYGSSAKALDALDAAQEAPPEPEKTPPETPQETPPEAPKTAQAAAKVPAVQANAPTGHYEALLRLFDEQDEEEIEMLLLAV